MNNLRQERLRLFTTSLIILFPIAAGLILWNRLPEQLPTHFTFSGEADGYSSRFFAVIILPLILLLMHLFVLFMTAQDPKHPALPKMMVTMIYWIVPVVSLFVFSMIYLSALGIHSPGQPQILLDFTGILFILIGNYLPKTKQNYTVGIKLPWTLNSHVNWNKTHRMAGFLYVICGFLCILSQFLPSSAAAVFLVSVLSATAIVPCVYSFMLYRSGKDHEEC